MERYDQGASILVSGRLIHAIRTSNPSFSPSEIRRQSVVCDGETQGGSLAGSDREHRAAGFFYSAKNFGCNASMCFNVEVVFGY